MTKPATKITTIAGVYADMYAACFAGKPITPAQEKLFKNLFYSGALGMFNLLEDIGNSVSDEDEGAARVAALRDELRAFGSENTPSVEDLMALLSKKFGVGKNHPDEDRTPDCIRAILDKPGKYCWMGQNEFGIEIDENQTVHQLTPEGVRDGILSPEGWKVPRDFGHVTPWTPPAAH